MHRTPSSRLLGGALRLRATGCPSSGSFLLTWLRKKSVERNLFEMIFNTWQEMTRTRGCMVLLRMFQSRISSNTPSATKQLAWLRNSLESNAFQAGMRLTIGTVVFGTLDDLRRSMRRSNACTAVMLADYSNNWRVSGFQKLDIRHGNQFTITTCSSGQGSTSLLAKRPVLVGR